MWFLLSVNAFDGFSIPGAGLLITTQGVRNLIASPDFVLGVALIPSGVINDRGDKSCCIQSKRYPIRGELAEKQRLAQVLLCI